LHCDTVTVVLESTIYHTLLVTFIMRRCNRQHLSKVLPVTNIIRNNLLNLITIGKREAQSNKSPGHMVPS